MKKLSTRLLVLICLMLALTSCKENPQTVPTTVATEPAATVTTAPSEEPGIPVLDGPQVKTTLMIYMIGSDLESKSGAATADLEEIAASGIDSQHNVLVFAGGARRWQSALGQENACTLLELTKEGFSVIETREGTSMGLPENLTEFLKFGCQNYPADRYALILWDHGNGPVMGYGKDEAHGGDALLLEEMSQAMAASPFGPENKLSWVGFDACLMASAELADVWSDYADYLVASQEVEPGFGWNYAFAKNLGAGDVPAFLETILDSYMQSCEEYYAQKDYAHRDTTLSCMDLSKAEKLEEAINRLFARAVEDVAGQYNLLTVRRVQTRALGRASTGSEYDLIDLYDMAVQLQEKYPEEAKALQETVEEMVLFNRTNTQQCCGMSLYYPFHNKYYYENSWQDIYNRLGVFTDYQRYLAAYGEIWQQNDKIKQLAAAVMPEQSEDGTYCLPLTAQQAENFAAAKYYILQRVGEGVYLRYFVSNDVTNINGVLVANFNGNILYVRDDYGNYVIPVVEEHDRVGDLARYSVVVSMNNIPAGLGNMPEATEKRIEGFRYYLTLNEKTGELSVSALLPREENPEENALFTGKEQEVDLSQWHNAIFVNQPHRYPTRDENGVLLPFDQWDTNTWFTGNEFPLYRGMEFVYEPLDGGEYYLVIEAQDTQGNSFCSELLPITVPDREQPEAVLPQTQVQWDQGSHILLKEENGVELYMTTVDVCGNQRYILELRNHNDFSVWVSARNLLVNGEINKYHWGSVTAKPGQTLWVTGDGDLVDVEAAGFLPELESVQFDIEMLNVETGKAVLAPQRFQVALEGEIAAAYAEKNGQKQPVTYLPFMGARAEEQILFADETIEVTLLGCGAETEDASSLKGWVRVENRQDRDVTVELAAMAVNKFYDTEVKKYTVMAGGEVYIPIEVSKYRLQDYGFTGISQLSLLLKVYKNKEAAIFSFARELWCDVTLAEAAPEEARFPEGAVVIWEKEGVRLALDPPENSYSDNAQWRMTVYNGTDRSVSVALVNATINGQLQDQHTGDADVSGVVAGPDQYGEGELNCYHVPLEELEEYSFCIQLRSGEEDQVLYTDTEIITVTDIVWPQEVEE